VATYGVILIFARLERKRLGIEGVNLKAMLSIKIKTLDGKLLPVKRTHPLNKVKQVVDSVVTHMSYPLLDDEQREIQYSLEDGRGRQLSLDSTLDDAGVKQDDVLTLKSSAETGKELETIVPPEGMINVYIQLLDLSRTEMETVREDKKISEILSEIVKKYGLPVNDDRQPGGKIYELFSKTHGTVLHAGMTLRDAKIPNQDTLMISAKETAG